MTYILKNDKLKIEVKKTGAELSNIESIKNGLSFMWDANPNIWGSYAPNLFPVIGALKDNCYYFNNKAYKLPKHGFIRHNQNIQLVEQTENSLVFRLLYNEASLKIYPFKFEFFISFILIGNQIEVRHMVKNLDSTPIYFSLGGHPAFKCPVFDNENYEDYTLKFEHTEHSKTHLINTENGLISSRTELVFNHTNELPMRHSLFNKDALIFKDLKSKKVILKSKHYGEILNVSYPDFPYLGVWAKPNGDYVCIEPWLGIADNEQTDQRLETKEGIIKLDTKNTFKASYFIEINQAHLL